MTDDEKRLDLRSLDAADDPRRTDALERSIMAEVQRRPRVDDLRELRRYRTALLAAAAVLATIALVSMLERPRESRAADVIAEWTRDGHVPTNGELLAAYQGYRP